MNFYEPMTYVKWGAALFIFSYIPSINQQIAGAALFVMGALFLVADRLLGDNA
jgi:hypothetical protein